MLKVIDTLISFTKYALVPADLSPNNGVVE